MVNLISPYEIIEMFHQKFDGFDFAQPYLIGEFKEDPRYGHITIGVRTPWYDIEYFVYSKASFDVGIANNKLVEDSIKWAVGHLNAAVAMQLSPDGSKAQRFDLGDINKYQEDPEGYIPESGPEVEQPGTTRDFDVYVNHDSNWSEQAMMDAENVIFLCDCDSCVTRMKRVREYRGEDILKKAEEKKRTADFGVVTAYVKHNNLWTDRTLVEAHQVVFLCTCEKCKQHADHILELRRESGIQND